MFSSWFQRLKKKRLSLLISLGLCKETLQNPGGPAADAPVTAAKPCKGWWGSLMTEIDLRVQQVILHSAFFNVSFFPHCNCKWCLTAGLTGCHIYSIFLNNSLMNRGKGRKLRKLCCLNSCSALICVSLIVDWQEIVISPAALFQGCVWPRQSIPYHVTENIAEMLLCR